MMDGMNLMLMLLVATTLIGGAIVVVVLVNLSRITATKQEVTELEGRLEGKIEVERGTAREELGAVHRRIDAQSEKISELIGETRAVGKNVEKLLDKGLA